MEMRPKFWLAGTTGVCAIIAVTLLPPQARESRQRAPLTPERVAAQSIGYRLATARRQLAVLEKRDAVLSRMSRETTDPNEPVIFAHNAFPTPLLEAMETELRAVWRRNTSNNGVRLAIDADYVTDNQSPTGVWYLLPHATDGSTCLISVTAGSRQSVLLDEGARPADVLEIFGWANSISRGPCIFYAAFGTPGPDIERWLDSRNFAFARLADWDTEQQPSDQRVTTVGVDALLGLLRTRGTVGIWDAMACAGGRQERCRAIMLADPGPQLSSSRYSREPRMPGYVAVNRRAYVFRNATAHFLSDVVREVGLDPFREFWTSDLPVDQAFASVVGRDIGEWTSDWLAERIGRQDFGPGVSGPGLLAVALLAGLGVFAGAYVAEKRKAG